MHDPATAEVWQTAFGKDLEGMAQRCNKTGQKGTNAMYVMTRAAIASTLAAGKKSLMLILSLITAHKRKTQTGFKLQQAKTSFNVIWSYQSTQQTSTQQKYPGIVW